MRYKRLHAQLRENSDWNSIESAFEAQAPANGPSFLPDINQPEIDYNDHIDQIGKQDPNLGKTFKRLNTYQRHAVFHPSKNTILDAMVGSGKTTVLIAKIFYLHFIHRVPFEEMVVLTFTNKAAREIKERIASFIGEVDANLNEQLRYFGTFHSVARQILEVHPKLEMLGFKSGFTILNEQDKQDLMQRLITQEDLSVKYQNQLSKRWKTFEETGSVRMGNMKADDDLERLIQLVEEEKRSQNSLDFNDLLHHCNALLREEIPEQPQWIIVDEFQDCNAVQLDFIENLRTDTNQVFVVGDKNQSIYGWRGSNEHIFQEVYEKWNATWMELPQNYRSTGNILSAAEVLVYDQNNTLIASRPEGNPITLIRHFDDQQEAYYLREKMLQLTREQLNNTAVLFRTHEQIKMVETVFNQANIPYHLGKKTDLHSDPAQMFLLQVLKLCCNANDWDACIHVICHKQFGGVRRTQKMIKQLRDRKQSETAVQAIVKYLGNAKSSSSELQQLFQRIADFSEEFIERQDLDTPSFIYYLGLTNLLKPTSTHHKDYINAVSTAWEQVLQYMHNKGWGSNMDKFKKAIAQVILEGTFLINERIKEQVEGVQLLTIHASKGLEFDQVYIAGVNTGIIPLTQHRGSQNMQEEKRLLFVAMTRGKDKVEMGWHVQPTLRNAMPEPSYFLNRIPDVYLERLGSPLDGKKEKKAEDTDLFNVQDKIQHKKYGTGIITAVTDLELFCEFESVGQKSFSTAFAQALLSRVE